MDTFLANDFGFVHFLHGIYFLGLFEFDAPDLPEAPLAHDVLAIEVVPRHFLALQDQSLLVLFFIELGEVNLETIFDVLVRFLGNG